MSKLNPQNATAYVGPGVLRKGGKITPVPNGPLIKKKGPFKGSTLKSGGTIKKAQAGKIVPVKSVSTLTAPKGTTVDTKPKGRELTSSDMTRLTSVPKTQKERSNAVSLMSYNNYVKDPKKGFQKAGLSFDDWMSAERERTMKNARNNPEPKEERGFFGGSNGPKSPCKGGKCSGLNSSSRNGSTIKKAKAGTRIKKAQNGEYVTKEGNNYTSTKKVKTKNGPRYYQGKSPNLSFAMEIASDKARKINDSIPKAKLSPRALEMMNKKNGGKLKKAQGGLNLVDVTPKSKNDTIAKKPVQTWVRNPNGGGGSPYLPMKKNKAQGGAMIKRADGSYSKRGLWDNIRANKGSGKKPTAEMLKQERKIKAKK